MKALVILLILVALGFWAYEKYWTPQETIPAPAPVEQPPAPVVASHNVKRAAHAISRHLSNADWGNALVAWEKISNQQLNDADRRLLMPFPEQIMVEIGRWEQGRINSLESAKSTWRSKCGKSFKYNHSVVNQRIQEFNEGIASIRNEANRARAKLR